MGWTASTPQIPPTLGTSPQSSDRAPSLPGQCRCLFTGTEGSLGPAPRDCLGRRPQAQCCTSWTVQLVVKASTTCLEARVDPRDLTIRFASCFSADMRRPLCRLQVHSRTGACPQLPLPRGSRPRPRGFWSLCPLASLPSLLGSVSAERGCPLAPSSPGSFPDAISEPGQRFPPPPQVLRGGTETQTQP